TGRLRRVELVEPLAGDLERFRPRAALPDDLVAPNAVGRSLDLHVWRRRVWKPACKRAGVAARPYDGRHTFASLLANEGHLMGYVALQLGHTTLQTTERYQHLFGPDQLRHRTPMRDAILAARAEVGASVAPPVPHGASVTVLRSAVR
ncbi:MAG TPA: tyrosine-type recombinase/integrase, partial [Gaiellales bacterium]|nr:tyrosine-type recombinase/integrase [Gaiellales bacterium]